MGEELSIIRGEGKRHLYWGVFFLLLQILVIVRNLSTDYFSFFWYCDFAPALFALLFFWRNEQAVKGLISIGFFMQLAYTLIIIVKLIFDVTLFGFVINFPLEAVYVVPTLIIHSGTMLALVTTYKTKPTKESLAYSLGFLVFIYALVLLFTDPATTPAGNYNFIYFPQLFNDFSLYTEIWVGIAFVLVAIPTYLFQLFVWFV
ncbi:MAG: hypothetical protein U1C52_01575, partial [Patescibacteria group bacterium]|nr:hypothetical protein [Patescibacteria group bacterium]